MNNANALNVLVADDNRDAADSLATLLRLWGHRPQVAYDGHAAVALARQAIPDVCLVDIGMPGLDGMEVVQTLRTDERFRFATFVAVTAYDNPIFRENFHCYIVKPLVPSLLCRALQIVGESRALQARLDQALRHCAELQAQAAFLRDQLRAAIEVPR